MYELKQITKDEAFTFIRTHHYSNVMPKLNKYFIGGYVNNELLAVITLGWGVRPLHTIKKLFPSLTSKDYLEIGKMCLHDKLPRNSESQFIKQVIQWIKINHKEIKVLYTWADGMLGKAGYVYQGSNFLYGGYIWTDSYFSNYGEKIHPRSTRELCKQDALQQGKNKVFWLSEEYQLKTGIRRYKGKQFRYCYFLCSNKEKKRLLKETTVKWGLNHPKHEDLQWKILDKGKYVICEQPIYNKKAQSVRSFKSETTSFQEVESGAIPLSRINGDLNEYI